MDLDVSTWVAILLGGCILAMLVIHVFIVREYRDQIAKLNLHIMELEELFVPQLKER